MTTLLAGGSDAALLLDGHALSIQPLEVPNLSKIEVDTQAIREQLNESEDDE